MAWVKSYFSEIIFNPGYTICEGYLIKTGHALFWGNTIIYALATISNTKKRQLIVNVKTEGKLQQIY